MSEKTEVKDPLQELHTIIMDWAVKSLEREKSERMEQSGKSERKV